MTVNFGSMIATAVALLPSPPVKVIVGAVTYPVPSPVTTTSKIAPSLIVKVAVAKEPGPPIFRVGGLLSLYELPPFVT